MADTHELAPVPLGMAFGVVWGAGVLLLGLFAWLSGTGSSLVDLASTFYVGYSATPIGSIIGGVWAFIDGFIGGALIAWLYNSFLD